MILFFPVIFVVYLYPFICSLASHIILQRVIFPIAGNEFSLRMILELSGANYPVSIINVFMLHFLPRNDTGYLVGLEEGEEE